MGKLGKPRAASAEALAFFSALRRLHREAGEPSMRDLARDIGGAQASHTTLHSAFLGPALPRWPVAELLVKALQGDVKQIKLRWLSAREAEDAEPSAAGTRPGAAVGARPDAESSAARRAADLLDRLSRTERGIAVLIAQGRTNVEIAEQLGLSRHTVDTHLRKMFAKLEINRRVELAQLVARARFEQ